MGLALFCVLGVPLICGLAAIVLAILGAIVAVLIYIFAKLYEIIPVLGWAFVIGIFVTLFILEQHDINLIFDVLFVVSRFVVGAATSIFHFFLAI